MKNSKEERPPERTPAELLFGEMGKFNMPTPKGAIVMKFPNARERFWELMEYSIRAEGKEFKWHKGYDGIVEWLNDSKGRGLLVHGQPGLGKSVACRLVIPAMIFETYRRIAPVYEYYDLNANIEAIRKLKIVVLDDIGREEVSNVYGNKRVAFDEIIDSAEKNRHVVIATTNLSKNELRDKYGDRGFDRILSTMTRVAVNGESFRF